jgi:tetratricopeptide (TPR) repeat protein
MSRHQTLLACAAIGACVVVGTLAVAYDRQNQIHVYFDNGLERNVKVAVGGESFNLAYGAPVERRMKPGSYEVVVSDDQGEIERRSIEIAKKDLMAALTDPEFYVYNIGAIHVYRRATIGYAIHESERSYSDQIYPFQYFFSQPEADYVFREAPEQITTKSSKEIKTEFTIARDLDYVGVASMRMSEGNLVEAQQAVDKALELDPCYVDAFRTKVLLVTMEGPTPGPAELLESFRRDCDRAGVEIHRVYQDLMNVFGDPRAVRADYLARQRRDPSAENDYLLARLLAGEDSLALYRSALAKKPDFARARLALAYDLMGMEKYSEALAEVETALDANQLVSDAASLYGYAAVGSAECEKVEGRLAPLVNQGYDDFQVWTARFTASLARQDWNGAERLLMEYRAKAGDEAMLQRIQYLELKNDAAQLKVYVDGAKARPELASDAARLEFRALYATGDYEGAALRLQALGDEIEDIDRLYAAVGLAMAGKRAEFRSQLAVLREAWSGNGEDAETVFLREVVSLFEGRSSPDAALGSAREAGFLMLPHAYFFLGAHHHVSGDGALARRYFERSAATAVSLEFPYLASRTLAGI